MTNFEKPAIIWRKSSASNSGNCVEVAFAEGMVLFRDSKNPDGDVLAISPTAWTAFVRHIRSSDFDLHRA